MLEELTTEYNIENWKEATKDWSLMAYSLEGFGKVPGTVYFRDSSQNDMLSSIRKRSHEKLSAGWSKLAKM